MNLLTKQFDLGNALTLVHASADAYQRATISVTDTDTHALIIEGPDYWLVTFRGSSSIRNWITDADFVRAVLVTGATGCCRVHAGFEQALSSILAAIIRALGGCGGVRTNKPIFLGGHSLGGSLAILAALELVRNGFRVAQVYTFGQPRVGNGDFCALYNAALGDSTYRMVYQEDIVPRIPHFPAWHDPYRHCGQEVFISSLSPLRSVDDLWFNPPLWRLLASDAWGIYRAWCISKFAGALDPAMDHHLGNYAGALFNLYDSIKPTGGGGNATETRSAEPTVAPATTAITP